MKNNIFAPSSLSGVVRTGLFENLDQDEIDQILKENNISPLRN